MPDRTILDQRYKRIYAQLEELLTPAVDRTARMTTAAALLHHKMPHFFWTGFYRLVAGELTIGPYQGSLACLVLPRGAGVCWAAVQARKTVIVPDVHRFPGHIACDSRSRSEIVVPLSDPSGEVWGVLDVDSDRPSAFSETDQGGLERIATLL
jgi:L-methionine (R)-S-oxide reductase